MMTNLFSFFDPSMSVFNLNWSSFFVVLGFHHYVLFNLGAFYGFLNIIVSFLYNESRQILVMKSVSYLFFVCVFLSFLFFNSSSMLPLIFPISSHISVILPISLTFWSIPLLVGWYRSTMFMLKSSLPQGTPYFLSPFLVLIELISIFIRPVTLAVRLSANITAGHLLLSILVQFISNLNWSMPFYFTIVLMNILEIGVSVIQAYVFFVLSMMYMSEV